MGVRVVITYPEFEQVPQYVKSVCIDGFLRKKAEKCILRRRARPIEVQVRNE